MDDNFLAETARELRENARLASSLKRENTADWYDAFATAEDALTEAADRIERAEKAARTGS